MHDPLHRLYRTKLALLAVVLLFAGLGLLLLGHWLPTHPGWSWLDNWPLNDVASGMFTTGLLGVALQYLDGADGEARDTARLRRVFGELTSEMRDAVIRGFAFEPEDLARVATPETLDQMITNGLGMRLGDPALAGEIYTDIRAQVVGVPERLHDARIQVRLSEQPDKRGTKPMFVATVRWEYEFRPAYGTRRFSSMSSLDEFRNLTDDTTASSGWYVGPRTGLDPAARTTFELVDFSVDGEPRPIRRTTRRGGQTYAVDLGDEAMASKGRIQIAYTYRALVSVDDHLLQFRVDQPTRGLAVELDYSDTSLRHMNVLDFISSSERTRYYRSAETLPGKTVLLEFEGWAMPRSGVALVW